MGELFVSHSKSNMSITQTQNDEASNMAPTMQNRWVNVTLTLASVLFIGAGLWLALLSNPQRFSVAVADDRKILLLAICGCGCTLFGIVLFLAAVSRTTKSMPSQLQMKANLGVGIGAVLQLAGFLLPDVAQVSVLGGVALLVVSLPFVVWGTVSFAQGKGYSPWVGLLGVAGVIGLLVLVLLPSHQAQTVRTTVA